MKSLAIIVGVLALLCVPLAAHSTTWYVIQDGSGDATTIQGGIDLASPGDIVLVAAGTYTGTGNRDLDFGGKDLVLLSGGGPGVTVIDCEGGPGVENNHKGFYFHSGESPAAAVQGFTIQNGFADHLELPQRNYCGGAMFCDESSPTIIDCVFAKNSATIAGAIYTNSDIRFVGCEFHGNSASVDWDVHVADVCAIGINPASSLLVMESCTMAAAEDDGFSIECGMNADISGSVFRYRTGGIWVRNDCALTLADCEFTWLSACGIEIDLCDATVTMTSCVFSYNGCGISADTFGSVTAGDCDFFRNRSAVSLEDGLYCQFNNCRFWKNGDHDIVYAGCDRSEFSSCVFLDNYSTRSAGALVAGWGEVSLQNCTFALNSCSNAGAIALGQGSVTISDSIIALSRSGQAVGYWIWPGPYGTATLECCDVYGNAGGDWVGPISGQYGIDGNIQENPLFCDLYRGYVGLQNSSPCRPSTPPNVECTDLIGAREGDCQSVSVECVTWGRVKAMYR